MNIKDKKVFIFIVIAIVVIAVVAVYALIKDGDNSTVVTTGSSNLQIATNESLDSSPVEELTGEEKSEAESRDQTRIQDISIIQSALQEYLETNGYYPDAIEVIVPDYLSALPIDPLPEQYEYSYTCIGSLDPCVLYDLSYTLEVGTDELLAGMNLVSPDEIATP